MKYLDPLPRHGYVNTGRVRIGIAYVPRARRLTPDEEQIQAGLIAGHGSRLTARGHVNGLVTYLVILIVFLLVFFTFL